MMRDLLVPLLIMIASHVVVIGISLQMYVLG